jgi:hypothetical protein
MPRVRQVVGCIAELSVVLALKFRKALELQPGILARDAR